jgi:hypothetical protein
VLARRSSQNKTSFFSPRCALVVFIRRAVHSSPAFVPLCTHRLHSPRSALIACIRHRGVVQSSPSFATLCAHRFHALATPLCTHQPIAFIRHAPRCALIASIRHAVHSSPPFATLCAHRFHSPRCALTPLEWVYCTYPIPVFMHITCMPPITKAWLDGSCLLVL